MARQGFALRGLYSLALWLATGCSPGPDDAVRELGEAFRNGDKLGVEARMDVERTVESAVDQSFELTMGSELRKSRSGFDSMDTFAGGAVANAMKPMLVRGLASGINGFAAGGNLTFPALGDTPQDHVPRDSILAAFRGIVKTETHDRLALVTVRIGRPGDDSVDVALKLEKGETGWRVVGLDNIAPVLQRLQQRPSTRRRPR